MAIVIEPKAEDFLIGRVLDKKWYGWKISDVTVKPKKDDPSRSNIVLSFVCTRGQDSRGPAAGVTAKDKYFPMDAKGQGYLVSFGKQIGLDVQLGVKFDVESWKDTVEFDGLSESSEYQGKLDNQLVGFAPAGKMPLD